MATLRELKGRIGSVASSEKITGAMKMISSAKMHKAESVIRRLTPFRDCVQTIITSLLSSDATVDSPLTVARQHVDKVAVVVFGSDDGLCGAYNVNMFKFLLSTLSGLRGKYGDGISIELLPVGKKMAKAVSRLVGSEPKVSLGDMAGITSKSEGDAVKDFGRVLQRRFLDGSLDAVELAYMRYYSAGRQRPVADVYLPLSAGTLGGGKAVDTGRPYIFEPDSSTIFATVLPMYLLSMMQEAFCQNRASEQAARVMAMQSANDNARKLLEQLQLEYNKLRQQSITTELLDIVGGQVRD